MSERQEAQSRFMEKITCRFWGRWHSSLGQALFSSGECLAFTWQVTVSSMARAETKIFKHRLIAFSAEMHFCCCCCCFRCIAAGRGPCGDPLHLHKQHLQLLDTYLQLRGQRRLAQLCTAVCAGVSVIWSSSLKEGQGQPAINLMER